MSLVTVSAEEMGIVAVVNDEVITQAEFSRALSPIYLQMQAELKPEDLASKIQEVRQRVLGQLIEERLMLQRANNPKQVEVSKGKIGAPFPITVSEIEVEEALGEAKGRFKTVEEFEEALGEQGLTEEDLTSRFRQQITISKLIDREIRSRVTVSPAEVTAYYEGHLDEFESQSAVQAAVLLIQPKPGQDSNQARMLAADLHRQIKAGADFYDLVKRTSDGPNAKMGGRVGFLEKGKSLKEIDSILFTLHVGEISPVIKTVNGFHIFKVESIRPARRMELSEVQSQIQRGLFQQKAATRYQEWIEKLKADAYISIKQ